MNVVKEENAASLVLSSIVVAVGGQSPCQAEVGYLDDQSVADEDIAGGQVTVNYLQQTHTDTQDID